MSTFIFSLNDISVSDDSPVVSVNNTDSFFGLIKGSQLFIAGKLPATIEDHDTTARTITLRENWAQGDLNSVAATVVPIGAVSTLLQALENNRAAYQAFLENAGGGGSGNGGEISWSVIIDPPITATSWPTWTQVQGDINEVLPETAKRFPNFPEIGGKVSVEQLPDDIDTDNKRTQALSPPVRQNPSLTHILSDYPTLKKTVDIPTQSPNNRREMLFDDVRQVAYVALTDEWLPISNIVEKREFLLTTNGKRIWFNSAYTGNLTLRVYPMGNGGNGLPDNPELDDYQWHTVTATLTSVTSFGSSFIGLIDYIETDEGFETLSTARSRFPSIDAYYGESDGSKAPNQFLQFTLRQDGDWYSEDVMPATPYSVGASWSQDTQDPRLFTVNEASGSTDALRLFNDNWDDYDFELVLVTDVPKTMALTVSNNPDYYTYFEGTYRFIVEQERIYFKRQSGTSPITGTIRIESLRLKVKGYE